MDGWVVCVICSN